ncbi:hypothetical protein ACHHYP_05267 [Achlya hypogyna]|uniref:BAR domain-containing protein n=1 Tax=Achlya hypogyna TaxID=1202772 RepID=A0A1V9YYH0_ACHHY|nr:hypothetical protein ACHHYP_05267 [Achlya hypogyna]
MESMTQTFWRRKRILTQEVLQAIGKTSATDDDVYTMELNKFRDFVSHVRAYLGELEKYRAGLRNFAGSCSSLATATAEVFAIALRKVDPAHTGRNQYHSVDDMIACAIRSVGVKLSDLELYNKDIKARADAKLEFDSYQRDPVKQRVAQAQLDACTLKMFRVFAKYEAAHDTFLNDELAKALSQLFGDAMEAMSEPLPKANDSIAAHEAKVGDR